jgi:hypothetical protein
MAKYRVRDNFLVELLNGKSKQYYEGGNEIELTPEQYNQVKQGCMIEHENCRYFEGDVVELPSALGAFHEPNLLIYAAPVEDTFSKLSQLLDVEEEPEEEEEDEKE